MKFRLPTLLATLALLLITVWGVPGVELNQTFAAETDSSPEGEETKDIIVLLSGTIVEGQILEETNGQVKIMINVSGIKAPVTYRTSEILEIQRDIPVVTNLPGARNPDNKANKDAWGKRDDKPAIAGGDIPKIYRFPMKGHIVGEFGAINYLLNSNRRDIISYTPVEKTMRDALSYNPDVIIVELDADAPSQIGWDGGIVSVPLLPIFQEVIDDPDVRLVFWVKEASFGAAFLPFICPEMYFESEAFFGGIGTLDDFDIGDELVNEKQISLRIVAAEGVAIKNGYNPAIIRGMARQQNWLCYRFRHGKVEFLEHEPRPGIDGAGWIILTDDGKGDFKDEMKIRGNDVLNINADVAQKIQLSKGTYDKIDDLIFSLGIRGDYDLIEGRSERNFDEWRNRVEMGLDRYIKINRDLEKINKGRRGDSEVKKLGRRRTLLRQLRGLMTTYEELFDPDGQERAGIDINIEQLGEAIRIASANERNNSKRNNNRRR